MSDLFEAPEGSDARHYSAVLIELLRSPPTEPLNDAVVAGFLQSLETLQMTPAAGGVAEILVSGDIGVAACHRLLALTARVPPTPAVLGLIDQFILHFGREAGLVEARLNHLLRLGEWQELVGEIRRTLDHGISSIHLAFRVILSVNRAYREGADDVAELYRRALVVFSAAADSVPEKELWWGRYFRETRNSLASLRHYLTFCDQPGTVERYRPAALREAGEIAVVGGRWGRDAPILLRARELEIGSRRQWRTEGALQALAGAAKDANLDSRANLPGTGVYSHLFDSIGTPESAFGYLIDQVLPNSKPYQPQNTLLMVGTSLAGGGMERIFANSYRAIRDAGVFDSVRMALLKFELNSPAAFYLADSGAAAEEIAVLLDDTPPEHPISMLPMGLARRVLPAYQLILRERPRVIHAWNDLAGVIAAFAGLLAGCPRIFVHLHHMRAINLSSDRNLIRSYPVCYRRLLERPEIELLFVADASADDYADWWCVERTPKFRRLYNGFLDQQAAGTDSMTMRKELGIPGDAPVVGTVFRFNAVKRPWLWIDVASLVHQTLPDTHFVMVGDGEEMVSSRQRVAALGLSDRFHFTGQVRNVGDHLSCFDLFLMTSWVEGLPNSLVEAQLAGVPIVSTNVGGVRETFVPGVTGVLVDGDSPQPLADAVVGCLRDEPWRRRAAVRSRQAALERFGIDRYLRSLISLYGPGC